MRQKPADWQSLPEDYSLAREAEKQRDLDLYRQRVEKRCLQDAPGDAWAHTVLNSGQE